jgi:transcription elongation factor Elf1
MSGKRSRGSRAERAAEKAERAALLKEAKEEFFKLFTCPICGYQSCLLGVVSHGISKHRVNLIAKSCRHAPLHRHRQRRGFRETTLKFVGE